MSGGIRAIEIKEFSQAPSSESSPLHSCRVDVRHGHLAGLLLHGRDLEAGFSGFLLFKSGSRSTG
jgi:hypothetical protein